MKELTKEQQEAKRKAEVMLAFSEGRKIEIKRPGESWACVSDPVWSWQMYDYRIKPSEPRRCEAGYFKEENDPWTACFPVGNRDNAISGETVQLIELTPEVIEALHVAGITYEGSEGGEA